MFGAIGDHGLGREHGLRLGDGNRLAGERRTRRSAARRPRQSRTSALTLSPGSTTRRSPGTSSLAGTRRAGPVADDVRLDGHHRRECVEGVLGARLLDEPDSGVGDDHAEDDRRIDRFTDRVRHGCGDQQDVDQRVMELQQQPHSAPRRSTRGSTLGPWRCSRRVASWLLRPRSRSLSSSTSVS